MMSDTDKKSDLMLLTVLLKHDQSKNLEDIQAHMKKVGWWDRFPVEGTRVVSWTVAMGLGQIVTLELPPALLPLVNVELERSAWGVFRTECYPTYDFVPVRERIRERVKNGGQQWLQQSQRCISIRIRRVVVRRPSMKICWAIPLSAR